MENILLTSHLDKNNYGVLLVNLGSPTAPTKAAIKDFLIPFLSDPRVVDKPRWFWLPLLRGLIIPLRAAKVAQAYQSIWTEQGSPLMTISQQQAWALQTLFDKQEQKVELELAMTYNKPSIEQALKKLAKRKVNKLVVLPLYPQYSSTTTAAVFDAVANACKSFKNIPDIRYVPHYYQQPSYISALANSVREYQQESIENSLLIFSFHGLPQRYIKQGDPYQVQCEQTAIQVAKELGLTAQQWKIAYQSRVGKEPWLQPYFDKLITDLPKQGHKNITVICPAFAADCLETLEEIDIDNRALFLANGGEQFYYIPALNANTNHINMMASLVKGQIKDWQ